jgi:membrane-bound metal-dependent hydrolase YbcI (DUF457 family)
MPLTPFHLGPALFLGLVFFSFLDFPTFLLANVIVDVEPLLVFLLDLDYPLHGFFHSFLGGTLAALLLAFIMMKIRGAFSGWLRFFKLEQEYSLKSILAASLSGVYIHILLDSRMHTDIKPFYPSDLNPFLSRGILVGFEVHTICIWTAILGIIVYGIKLFLTIRKEKIQN